MAQISPQMQDSISLLKKQLKTLLTEHDFTVGDIVHRKFAEANSSNLYIVVEVLPDSDEMLLGYTTRIGRTFEMVIIPVTQRDYQPLTEYKR